jgi:hypothetical protein
MPNLDINLDAEIGQIKQRIDDLQAIRRNPPDDLTGTKIRVFQEAIDTEVSRLDTTAFLLRERSRALKDAAVVVAALSDADLAATKEALALLDSEVKRDQAGQAILDLLPKLTTAASKVVFAAGSATKKA